MMVDSCWTCILTLLATVSPVALQTNGGFSPWSTWTLPSCAVTCGASVTAPVQRTRTCTNPPPSNGGLSCTGPILETALVNCDLTDCPDDVGFNEWGQWTSPECDVTCGDFAAKLITRERTCMYPSPKNDSGNCTGSFVQTAFITCNLPHCSVNGGISEWGQWYGPSCPGSCDGMANTTISRTRNRTCSNPPPSNGGRNCTETRTETGSKNCCPETSSSTWQLALGISVGVAALLGLIVIAVCVVRRRNTPQKAAYSFKEKPLVPDRLELIALLGEGKFGEVWRARALNVLSSGQWDFVAVKKCKDLLKGKTLPILYLNGKKTTKPLPYPGSTSTLPLVTDNATEAVREDFKHEIELMKSVPRHPNIVNYLSFSTKEGSDLLILELAPLGNLLNLLRSRRPRLGTGSHRSSDAETQEMTSKQLTMFAHQVARGMKHLHYNRIIHRDLAARNVLLGENFVCKVSDLGLARNLSDADGDAYETKSGGPLPIRWMAPESLQDRLFSTKSDVWSFGILVWEIVTLGASPYTGQAARDVINFVTTGGRMPRPDHCAPQLFSLMTKCWHQDPESRPDFKDLSSELDTLLEESSDYIKLSSYQNDMYLILRGQSGDLEEKV